jgi:hypothetical protein
MNVFDRAKNSRRFGTYGDVGRGLPEGIMPERIDLLCGVKNYSWRASWKRLSSAIIGSA